MPLDDSQRVKIQSHFQLNGGVRSLLTRSDLQAFTIGFFSLETEAILLLWNEDDDEPIQLTDQDDSHVIKEYNMSFIGKILNPKKQNVEKLIQKCQTSGECRIETKLMFWGMEVFCSVSPQKTTQMQFFVRDPFTTIIVCLCW